MKKSLLAALFAAASISALPAAESLGEMIRGAGHGAIVGTWVDEASGGQAVKVTYDWKIKDHALTSTVVTGERISTALIGIDPETGDVLHTGYDNRGGTIAGRWDGDDKSAILEATYIDSEQTERSFVITHTFISEDKLRVTMRPADSEGGTEITLVRASG